MTNTFQTETSGSMHRLDVHPEMTQREAMSQAWKTIQAENLALEAESILKRICGEQAYYIDYDIRRAHIIRHNLMILLGEFHTKTQAAISALRTLLNQSRVPLSDEDRETLDLYFDLEPLPKRVWFK